MRNLWQHSFSTDTHCIRTATLKISVTWTSLRCSLSSLLYSLPLLTYNGSFSNSQVGSEQNSRQWLSSDDVEHHRDISYSKALKLQFEYSKFLTKMTAHQILFSYFQHLLEATSYLNRNAPLNGLNVNANAFDR